MIGPSHELHPHNPESPEIQLRFTWARGILGVSFLLLGVRLFQLQQIQGGRYEQISRQNVRRPIRVEAPRGMIKDRYGRILVDNRHAEDCALVLDKHVPVERVLPEVAALIDEPVETLEQRLAAGGDLPPFYPVKLKRNLTDEETARVKVRSLWLPGVRIEEDMARLYPFGQLAAHVLGYVGEIDDATLKDLRSRRRGDYRLGDMIGKLGVEERMEPTLRGKAGFKFVEVDALGRELRRDQDPDLPPGENVVLTLDLDLQREAEEIFQGVNGALIAMDPKTGEILAMVSHPAFNPDLMSTGTSREDWQALVNQPGDPLENKAVRGQYPPGSTFKLITAAAALEAGAADPQTTLGCRGALRMGPTVYRCWRRSGHGVLSLKRAIIESCDVYFYQIGLRVGAEKIVQMARAFGLGSRTGIDLTGEKPGLVPTEEWKRKVVGEPWRGGDTVLLSVGQGFLLATPLQILEAYAALSTGRLMEPRLVLRVEDSRTGKVLKQSGVREIREIPLSPAHRAFLVDALTGVVNAAGGTAGVARIPGVEVAGKTGTAQVARFKVFAKEEETPVELRDHAWFVGFAPAEDPRIAAVALVEHGGFGASASAPRVRRILERFFALEASRVARGEAPAAP